MRNLYAGLDVSLRTTAICIVDAKGSVVAEYESETDAAAIADALKPYRRQLDAVGYESGVRLATLRKGLAREKFRLLCLDARHASAALKARLNKTDANDARALAQLVASGIYTLAYVKTDKATRIRTILGFREVFVRKTRDFNSALTMAGRLVADLPTTRRRKTRSEGEIALEIATEETTKAANSLRSQLVKLDKLVSALAKDDPTCCRLMTIPGVGPITALTFFAGVDDPHRFKASRNVAAYFGLTPRVFQSGATTRSGRISHRGDASVRKALYGAARSLLVNARTDCSLRRWGLRLARTKGRKIAYVAVARKMAVLMHHLWVTGEDFDPSR